MSIDSMEIDVENFIYILDSNHKENYSMNYHIHHFYELTYVVDGRGCCYELNEGKRQRHDMFRDYILLRDGRLPHRTQDSPGFPLKQLIIIFDEYYLKKIPDYKMIINTLDKENPLILTDMLYTRQLKPQFREILKEMQEQRDGKDSQVLSLIIRLLVHLMRAGECPGKSHSMDIRIERVLEYMRQNFFLNLSLTAAAGLSNLSQRQFSELFKKETGQTFTEHLNTIRIGKAKESLQKTSRSITEIAFEIGYDDLSYFSRRFKLSEGMSPREFRKRFR